MASLSERLRNFKLVRKIVYAIVGLFSWPGLAIINKLKISGTEHLEGLPKQNVLFVSNHQTYFADVITFLHIFCAVKWGKGESPWHSLLFIESIHAGKLCSSRANYEGKLDQPAFYTGRCTDSQANLECRSKGDSQRSRPIGYKKDNKGAKQQLGDHFSAGNNQTICTRAQRHGADH